MRSCTCPVGTYLTPPGTQTCPENVGQIQKLAFHRYSSTTGFGTGTTILLEATWTAAMALTETTPNNADKGYFLADNNNMIECASTRTDVLYVPS